MATEGELPYPAGGAPGMFESLGKKLDARPEIQAAEEAVRAAREQLEKAQAYCEHLRAETAEEFQDLRQTNLGDVLEKTLAFVRRNPGVGVSVAAFLGFFLGRLFRR